MIFQYSRYLYSRIFLIGIERTYSISVWFYKNDGSFKDVEEFVLQSKILPTYAKRVVQIDCFSHLFSEKRFPNDCDIGIAKKYHDVDFRFLRQY